MEARTEAIGSGEITCSCEDYRDVFFVDELEFDGFVVLMEE